MTGAEPSELQLGDLIATFGGDPADVLAIRHTSLPHGLPDVATASAGAVLEYTRDQDARPRVFPANPAPTWLVFMEDRSHDGLYRSRFYCAYNNGGEVAAERTETNRRFALSESDFMASLRNRLVIEWTTPRRWHRQGPLAAKFRVLEIAERRAAPFPGFHNLRLTFRELDRILHDPLFNHWQTALSAVRGIYLIADTGNGMLYVGLADGVNGILGRWTAYAADGHGGNMALRAADTLDVAHRERFVFSILRVFGPEALRSEIAAAESHYKNALLTRSFGYNEN